MRAFVTGNLEFDDYNMVSQALKECWREDPRKLVIIHTSTGSALDAIAQGVGNDNWDLGVTVEAVASQRLRDGSSADFVRNRTIWERGVDVVLVFSFADIVDEFYSRNRVDGRAEFRYFDKLDERAPVV